MRTLGITDVERQERTMMGRVKWSSRQTGGRMESRQNVGEMNFGKVKRLILSST